MNPESFDYDKLKGLARDFRVEIIKMLVEAKSGHPGGSLSAVDLLTVLWFSHLRGISPERVNQAPHLTRDHFILSKGHGVPALYVILAKQGFITEKELMTLRKLDSRLQGHPDRVRLPIVEASTGSLGQGLSVAIGMALGNRAQGSEIYCMLGDGEVQEGQVWEAALCAPKYELSNLCAILDANGGQIDGPVSQVMPIEPLADKWRAFGWHVIEIDGHDLKKIHETYAEVRRLREGGSKKPVFVVARTIKGKGVSFMENNIGWHGVVPTDEQGRKAIEELLR